MSALTVSFPSLDRFELDKLGADEHLCRLKALLDPVSDPATHWQTTSDWCWMVRTTCLLVPEGVTASSLCRTMLDACLNLGGRTRFPLAITDLQVVSDWLSGLGTKKAVNDAHHDLNSGRWERWRLDSGFTKDQNEVLAAIEFLTHIRKPLSHLYGCFHTCNTILGGVGESPNKVLAEVLRADLPSPFV